MICRWCGADIEECLPREPGVWVHTASGMSLCWSAPDGASAEPSEPPLTVTETFAAARALDLPLHDSRLVDALIRLPVTRPRNDICARRGQDVC